MKPPIKIECIRTWIAQSRILAYNADCRTHYQKINGRQWRHIATLCRRAQRLLAKAKWQAEANAVRVRQRRTPTNK